MRFTLLSISENTVPTVPSGVFLSPKVNYTPDSLVIFEPVTKDINIYSLRYVHEKNDSISKES